VSTPQPIAELGLHPTLADTAAAQGIVEATPLQAASMPVLRRGGNAVLHASSGAGLTVAWALPLLDRLLTDANLDAPDARALVLAPTDDRASQLAHALAHFGVPAGLRARALGSGWNQNLPADVVVGTPARALDAVERSALKLDGLQVLVLTEYDVMHRLGGADAVDTITALLPHDAQRVVTAAELTPKIEQYVEAHVRRALMIPGRAADARERAAVPPVTGTVGFAIAPEAHKQEVLVRLLDARAEARSVIVARSERRADELRAALSLRGFEGGSVAEAGVRVESALNAPATGATISYDVPFDAEMLRILHRAGGIVLAAPREMPHLRRIAAEAGLSLQAERVEPHAADALGEYRRTIKQALHNEDIDAQLAILDPLFEEFSAAEIAAALSALLRKRAPAVSARPASVAPPVAAVQNAGNVRLFISMGTKDNIRPADLVGAITNEAGIKGDQVGKIDIRETFSVVEVASAVADRVIRALNGTTVRGRSVRVDYDRKGAPSPPRRPAPRMRRDVQRE
jgi:ATP-dependent RNA helicase DeaD